MAIWRQLSIGGTNMKRFQSGNVDLLHHLLTAFFHNSGTPVTDRTPFTKYNIRKGDIIEINYLVGGNSRQQFRTIFDVHPYDPIVYFHDVTPNLTMTHTAADGWYITQGTDRYNVITFTVYRDEWVNGALESQIKFSGTSTTAPTDIVTWFKANGQAISTTVNENTMTANFKIVANLADGTTKTWTRIGAYFNSEPHTFYPTAAFTNSQELISHPATVWGSSGKWTYFPAGTGSPNDAGRTGIAINSFEIIKI